MDNNNENQSNSIVKDRQSIREVYKQLVQDAKKYVEENDMDGITEICDKMKQIYNQVKHTREAILDMNLMNHLASFGYNKIQTIETNFIYFNPRDFIEKLLECNTGILKNGYLKMNYAPCLPFIFINSDNLFDNNDESKHKKRKQLTSNQNNTSSTNELIKVAKLSTNELGDDHNNNVSNFSTNIIQIYDLIEELYKTNCRPVHLSDVLSKAKDFSQAVDYNFCISFLVRDGKLMMQVESHEITDITLEPIINDDYDNTKSKDSLDNNSTKNNNFQQMVLPLDYNTWNRIANIKN